MKSENEIETTGSRPLERLVRGERVTSGKTARLIKNLEDFTGHAALYELSEPLASYDGEKHYKYVVVSATNVMLSGPETYIFPADEKGEVTEWGELAGSYRGGLSHSEALEGVGYTLL